MGNLERVIAEINKQGIAGDIWIDGSFLTEKLNPDDVDIAFIVSTTVFHNLSTSQRRFFEQFSGTSLYDLYKIDNYGIVLDHGDPRSHWLYSYWLRQFGFSRADEMKGILKIAVPFVIVS